MCWEQDSNLCSSLNKQKPLFCFSPSFVFVITRSPSFSPSYSLLSLSSPSPISLFFLLNSHYCFPMLSSTSLLHSLIDYFVFIRLFPLSPRMVFIGYSLSSWVVEMFLGFLRSFKRFLKSSFKNYKNNQVQF